MALNELSQNLPRSLSTAEDLQAKARDGTLRSVPATALGGAVQSMLKTTTEIGDRGQFVVRPPRIAKPGSRIQSTRPRSGSFDASFASSLRHQTSPPYARYSRRHRTPGPTPSFTALSTHNIMRSNLTIHDRDTRTRRSRPYSGRHGLEGLASPGPGSTGLYNHRSLITLRSHRDLQSMYSGSPRTQASRSTKYRHQGRSPYSYPVGPRPPYPRASSVRTAASSPASMVRHQGFPGYHPDQRYLYASFATLPSSAVPTRYMQDAIRPQYPSRADTLGSLSSQPPRAHSRSSVALHAGLPRSPTGSTAPYYYDYSESFVEGSFSRDTNQSQASLSLNTDYVVLAIEPALESRKAQSPFGNVSGSCFRPAELPTKHNRRPSQQSNDNKHRDVPLRVSSLEVTEQGRTTVVDKDHVGTILLSMGICWLTRLVGVP